MFHIQHIVTIDMSQLFYKTICGKYINQYVIKIGILNVSNSLTVQALLSLFSVFVFRTLVWMCKNVYLLLALDTVEYYHFVICHFSFFTFHLKIVTCVHSSFCPKYVLTTKNPSSFNILNKNVHKYTDINPYHHIKKLNFSCCTDDRERFIFKSLWMTFYCIFVKVVWV